MGDKFQKICTTAAVLIALLFLCLGINDWYDCSARGGTLVRPFMAWHFECVQVLR